MSADRLLTLDENGLRRLVLAGATGLVLLGATLTVFVHPLAGIALAAGVLIAPLVLRSSDYAFVALVAVITLLPFAALPFSIGFKPTLLDLALVALYGIWVFRLVTRDLRHRWPPLSAAVLLFMALAVAAFVAGLSHGMPTRNQIRIFLELILSAGLFFVVADLIDDRRALKRVFVSLVVMGFVAALIGIGLYLLPDALEVRLLSSLRPLGYPAGSGVLRYINDDPTRLQRATGTSIDPNSFGGMLAVIAALLVAQVSARSPLVGRRTAALLAAGVVVALLATVSRGSLVGLVAAVAVIGVLRDRKLLLSAAAGLVALLALARVVPWTSHYVSHFTAGIALADRATLMRLGEYKDAVRLIQRYPLFGVGFGDVRDVDLYRGVSSLYLIIAETMGAVGLVAFLGMVGAFLWRIVHAVRALQPDDSLQSVLLGSLAALAAALVSGAFDHYFFTYPHAFALLWLVLAMAVSAIELGHRMPRSPEMKEPGLPLARPLPARRRR